MFEPHIGRGASSVVCRRANSERRISSGISDHWNIARKVSYSLQLSEGSLFILVGEGPSEAAIVQG